ncbi:MAG TPA: hypothetical protein VFN11_07035 [Ktedonobacterales bacterium]|nr:hypothetical protein [Ktedonobacterales bacterium]
MECLHVWRETGSTGEPARPKDRLLPAISLHDDAGRVTYVSIGWLAFLWMFATLYRIFIRTWRMQRADSVLARMALAGAAFVPMFLFAGFTGPNFEARTVAIWLWLVGGLVVAVGRQGRVIQLNRPLLPQLKRTASEELFILAGPRALPDTSSPYTPEESALQAPPRPETWERAITPRWTPNGPSGLPPVRSFWDDEPD